MNHLADALSDIPSPAFGETKVYNASPDTPSTSEETTILGEGKRETAGEMRELVEAVAKAIHESTFDESYDGLSEEGIDKAFARQHAIAALNAVADFGDARFAHPNGAVQAAKAEADHFKSHFTKLAKVNAAANAALDTARREWAKRGEG